MVLEPAATSATSAEEEKVTLTAEFFPCLGFSSCFPFSLFLLIVYSVVLLIEILSLPLSTQPVAPRDFGRQRLDSQVIGGEPL